MKTKRFITLLICVSLLLVAWHTDGLNVSVNCIKDSENSSYSVSINQNSEWPNAFIQSHSGDDLSGTLNPGETKSGSVVIGWPNTNDTEQDSWSVTGKEGCKPEATNTPVDTNTPVVITNTPVVTNTPNPGKPTKTKQPKNPTATKRPQAHEWIKLYDAVCQQQSGHPEWIFFWWTTSADSRLLEVTLTDLTTGTILNGKTFNWATLAGHLIEVKGQFDDAAWNVAQVTVPLVYDCSQPTSTPHPVLTPAPGGSQGASQTSAFIDWLSSMWIVFIKTFGF